MSRQEIKGETFTIAFGVDRVTGAFAQLWVNPCDDQDCAAVIFDSHGVHVDNDQADKLNEKVIELIDLQRKSFNLWRNNNARTLPNLDENTVINLAQCAGGFPGIARDVYRIFGDNC